jgi:hypothetical protein
VSFGAADRPLESRVEKAGNAGFARVRDFLRPDDDERIVTLAAPERRDSADYECPAPAQTVRLVRHIASTGKVRVLMTNLLDPALFPAHDFGKLYHQPWRIEEAFKRLKHRLNLEHATGLSKKAAMHDFATKIVCDNHHSLATEMALREAAHQSRHGSTRQLKDTTHTYLPLNNAEPSRSCRQKRQMLSLRESNDFVCEFLTHHTRK